MNSSSSLKFGRATRQLRKKGRGESVAIGAAKAEAFLKALANRHRLLLLCTLIEGEAPVGELAQRLDISQPNVSQHLAKMRALGLVVTRREGSTIHYSIGDAAVVPIVEALYRKFCS